MRNPRWHTSQTNGSSPYDKKVNHTSVLQGPRVNVRVTDAYRVSAHVLFHGLLFRECGVAVLHGQKTTTSVE